MTRPEHVIVVGAGIGGMASALLIARTGASVTLLERVAAPSDVLAGRLVGVVEQRVEVEDRRVGVVEAVEVQARGATGEIIVDLRYDIGGVEDELLAGYGKYARISLNWRAGTIYERMLPRAVRQLVSESGIPHRPL